MTMDAQAWVALGALIFLIAMALIGMAVYLIGKIELVRDTMHRKSDELHARVNNVKDDQTNNYLRKDDLATHLGPLKEAIEGLRADLREIIKHMSG